MPKNPIPENMQGISGIQLLSESLRAKCVYEVLRNKTGENSDFFKWFNYMINVESQCQSKELFTAACTNAEMKNLQVLPLLLNYSDRCG
jgi:hypothetical protein